MPPRFLLLCLLLAGWLVTPPPELSAQTSDFQAKAEQAAEEEAYASALEACLYGYPRAELWSRIQNETRRVTEDQVIFAPSTAFTASTVSPAPAMGGSSRPRTTTRSTVRPMSI
jgi:hypothetical protein